jgi:hypothetical protein
MASLFIPYLEILLYNFSTKYTFGIWELEGRFRILGKRRLTKIFHCKLIDTNKLN